MFTAAEERRLDAEFEVAQKSEAEAQAAAAPSGPLLEAVREPGDPIPFRPRESAAAMRKRQRAFAGRLDELHRTLPLARVRTNARRFALGSLVMVLAVLLLMRTEIVRQFPDLAGAYSAIGLGVNTVGVEFQNVRTLKVQRDGDQVLIVDARIVSVSDRTVAVPTPVVSLLDGAGRSIYEWSVTPPVHELEPGEGIDIQTQLLRPPEAADGVRLTFNSGRMTARAS